MEPKFKLNERVWSTSYECWGTILDASMRDLLTKPYMEYEVFLDTHRGIHTTTADYLESEAEHGTTA